MTPMNWLGVEVVARDWLPEGVIMLRSGRQLVVHDTRTGETRTMEIPPFVLTPVRLPRDEESAP